MNNKKTVEPTDSAEETSENTRPHKSGCVSGMQVVAQGISCAFKVWVNL